jgi:hypothetical protein
VERTLAWFTRNRRLAKDYEKLPETGETFLYMAMSRIHGHEPNPHQKAGKSAERITRKLHHILLTLNSTPS